MSEEGVSTDATLLSMNGMTTDNGCSNEGATDDGINMCNEDVLDSINMCNEVGVSEEMGRDPHLRSDVGDEEDDDEEDESNEGYTCK